MEQQQREGAAFLEAAATGNVLEARRFLQNSPRLVDFVDRLGWTGLLVAVEARHVKMVELLLASGADPHHRSSVDGMHALHVLAEQGQRDFLSADADEVEERKAAGKLLDILLDAGVDPNVPTTSGETVLHLMCLRGNIDGVRELLARRLVADIDARNTHGDTALHYASRKGHQEIVRLLVAHGASPAAESQFGTPGQVASESRQDHITELLRSLARHQTDGDDDNDDHDLQRLGLWSLPPEVVVHALSFVANARDLCSVSLTCRALAAISRDDGLWKPLGHPSWADHQVAEESGWKGAYMKWLRAAMAQRRKPASPAPLRPAGGQQQTTNYDLLAKVVMLGITGVGKTSVLHRYTKGTMTGNSLPTIGSDFVNHPVTWNGARIKMQLWDIAGPERFTSVTPIYYRGAKGLVLVYDIADLSSFNATAGFLQEIQWHAPEDVSVVLVGNKTDLAPDKRVVTEQMGRQRAEEWGVRFCECSAKAGEGVTDAFDLVIAGIMGGWQCVSGMATPAHVPSDALLAQLFPTPTTATAASFSSPGGNGTETQQQQRCVLQ